MSAEPGLTDAATPACPDCGRPLAARGMVLVRRTDDGRRVCRAVLRCAARHTWWQWADRPDAGLERCPYPQLF
ncbi:dehydrogenase [Streptomyces sp. NPDC058676]|uniref:dehydrogenase n=1 Tax=unclassified Streptomyces TaxID=2593676 RepID=UPI00364F8197